MLKPLKLTPPFKVAYAKKILRIAVKASKCKHKKLSFELIGTPDIVYMREKNRWAYSIECKGCGSDARVTCEHPVCERCSNVKELHLMRLQKVREGIFNLNGKLLEYKCPNCKNCEDFEVLEYIA